MQNALPVPLAMFSPWILVSCKQDDSVGMKQRGDQCVWGVASLPLHASSHFWEPPSLQSVAIKAQHSLSILTTRVMVI